MSLVQCKGVRKAAIPLSYATPKALIKFVIVLLSAHGSWVSACWMHLTSAYLVKTWDMSPGSFLWLLDCWQSRQWACHNQTTVRLLEFFNCVWVSSIWECKLIKMFQVGLPAEVHHLSISPSFIWHHVAGDCHEPNRANTSLWSIQALSSLNSDASNFRLDGDFILANWEHLFEFWPKLVQLLIVVKAVQQTLVFSDLRMQSESSSVDHSTILTERHTESVGSCKQIAHKILYICGILWAKKGINKLCLVLYRPKSAIGPCRWHIITTITQTAIT